MRVNINGSHVVVCMSVYDLHIICDALQKGCAYKSDKEPRIELRDKILSAIQDTK